MDEQLKEVENAIRVMRVLNNVLCLAKTSQTASVDEMMTMVVRDTDECEKLSKRFIGDTKVIKIIESIFDKDDTDWGVYCTLNEIVE